MEKVIEFIKKNWIGVLAVIFVIYFIYINKKRREAETKAVALFNALNGMAARTKQGEEYSSEKSSLIKLVDNASPKEREILSDLLNGTISVFTAAGQAQDKEQAKNDFPDQIAKMQSDLIAKHGQENVMSLKAKMDKYGFDI